MEPVVALVVRAAGVGALSGALSDYGINDDFIKQMAKGFEPSKSALFILARRRQGPAGAEGFGGKVLKTSLTNEQEARLREALQGLSAVPA